MKRSLLICTFLFGTILSFGQTILIIVNNDCKIYVDGEEKGKVKANDALKITVSQGEHYIQAKGKWNGQDREVNQTIKVEDDKQIIVKLTFNNEINSGGDGKIDSNAITVADLSLKLPGTIEVNQWKSDNPGKEYNGFPIHYYAFEKGDEIVLDYRNPGSSATNKLIVSTYPGKETKYSNKSFTELNDIHIKVDERSIFVFGVATNHAFATTGELIIKRIPASAATKDFNTNVSRVKKYTPVSIQSPQVFTVHSQTHLTSGDRVTIPIQLPANTVEWFYKFGASRNQGQIDEVKSGLKLFSELAALCGPEGKALAGGIDLLSTPPGTDNCDVYLFDEQNHSLFENNKSSQYIEEGTRQGLMSGKVLIKSTLGQTYYIGISNPSTFWPVTVAIEVVAITEKEELVMDQQ